MFWRVVMPQIRPAVRSGGLLVALYVISDFGAVSLLRCRTFTWVLYSRYTSPLDSDRAAAAVLALMLVAMTLVLLGLDYLSRER